MMMGDTLVRDFDGGVTLVCEPWMEGRPRQRPEPTENPMSKSERRLMLMERLVEVVNAAPKPISAADAAAMHPHHQNHRATAMPSPTPIQKPTLKITTAMAAPPCGSTRPWSLNSRSS